MTWVRLDDQFPEHPKVLRVGADAAWLHVSALCYCARQLTDGFVPDGAIGRLAEVKKPVDLAARLVGAGLWAVADGGWQINDYLAYNPSREKVLADRNAAAARKERWKERQRNAVPNAGGTQKVRPPRPDPTRPGPKEPGSGSGTTSDGCSPPAADGGGEPFDPELSKRNAKRVADELAKLRDQKRNAS